MIMNKKNIYNDHIKYFKSIEIKMSKYVKITYSSFAHKNI